MHFNPGLNALYLLCAMSANISVYAEQQGPLFISNTINKQASLSVQAQVMSKAEIAVCVQMQEERVNKDARLLDHEIELQRVEGRLLNEEQAIKSYTDQINKLEFQARHSASAMNLFRREAQRYNRQLDGYNQLKRDYQAAVNKHNQLIHDYNQLAKQYRVACASRQFMDADLQQVQTDRLNIARNKSQ